MIKALTKAQLRGKPLERECYRARTTTERIDKKTIGTYCFGLFKEFADGIEIDDICEKC